MLWTKYIQHSTVDKKGTGKKEINIQYDEGKSVTI